MFVVCKQNDGNSKLIISVFFRSFILLLARLQMTMMKNLTGAIYVVDELDYETKQNYDLIIRATDSVSGVYAEVPLSIAVSGNLTKGFLCKLFQSNLGRCLPPDVNDCPPTLPQDNYDITVSESAPFGSVILKVAAQDSDGPGNYKFISA